MSYSPVSKGQCPGTGSTVKAVVDFCLLVIPKSLGREQTCGWALMEQQR